MAAAAGAAAVAAKRLAIQAAAKSKTGKRVALVAIALIFALPFVAIIGLSALVGGAASANASASTEEALDGLIPVEDMEAVKAASDLCDSGQVRTVAATIMASPVNTGSVVWPVTEAGTAINTLSAAGAKRDPAPQTVWGAYKDVKASADLGVSTDVIMAVGTVHCALYSKIMQLDEKASETTVNVALFLGTYSFDFDTSTAKNALAAVTDPSYADRVTAFKAALNTLDADGVAGDVDGGTPRDAGGGPGVRADGTGRESKSGSGWLDTSTLCAVLGTSFKLRCDAAASLEELNTAYKKTHNGKSIVIISAYRDYATQKVTKRLKGPLAAPAGLSNHGWGLAIDISTAIVGSHEGTESYRWFRTNAPKFGWNHPAWARKGGTGPQEIWHWEWVGVK